MNTLETRAPLLQEMYGVQVSPVYGILMRLLVEATPSRIQRHIRTMELIMVVQRLTIMAV